MVWEGRTLESITEDDLQSLVNNGEPEDKTLEYKESLPPYGPQDKIEFSADVSSFANAAGGHLIYGVREKRDPEGRPSGIPDALPCVGNVNMDETIRRLESVLQDRLEPRLTGVNFRPVTLESPSSKVLIIRVPRSWNGPHAVKDERRRLFYLRGTARKDLMDVGELRTAFNLSETTYERIRNFRLDRISKIISGETPVPLLGNPKVVFHLVPLNAFDPAVRFDAALLEKCRDNLLPLPGRYHYYRHNFDGYLTYVTAGQDTPMAYVQLFRNGCLEALDADLLQPQPDNQAQVQRVIPDIYLEKTLIEVLPKYVQAQKELGIEPPIIIMLSLLGVKGYTILLRKFPEKWSVPIDRDLLLIPDILCQEFPDDARKAARELRPAFDAIWNAAGQPGSANYDKDGNWQPRR